MASFSSSFSAESGCKCHVRSVSLPSQSHPIVISVKDTLHRLKHSDDKPTSAFGSMSSGFASLEDLHVHVADLLDMASTQQALRQQDRNTNALLDSSVLLLDVCGVARDIVSQVKEYVQLLQSSIRLRKGDSSIASSLRNYVNFRYNARKDMKRLIAAMKPMKIHVDVALGLHHYLETSAVMKVLREVDELSMVRFQTMPRPFLNPVSRNKQLRWLSISRFMQKGKKACEENPKNFDELENIDAALYALSNCCLKTIKIQLQQVEGNISGLELALESMFRQLVSSRACLLNMLSIIV